MERRSNATHVYWSLRYHGLLAPAAKWRSLVVPGTDAAQTSASVSDIGDAFRSPDVAAAGGAETEAARPARHGRNYAWAELMARVFSWDVLACEHCGGKLRIIATINAPETARKILDWRDCPLSRRR